MLKLAVQNLTRNNPLPEIANRLLDSINFHLTAGDRIALQGKSGAGKSLLMRAIMLGMILGNSLNAISLSIDRFRDGLHQDRERIENLLTLGATSWESSREIAADAIRVGLLPMINTMTVTGIVSLPGMMTGQLLSGVSPLEAVKYQIVILALIATTTTLGCLLAIGLTFKQSFSTWHALARS